MNSMKEAADERRACSTKRAFFAIAGVVAFIVLLLASCQVPLRN